MKFMLFLTTFTVFSTKTFICLSCYDCEDWAETSCALLFDPKKVRVKNCNQSDNNDILFGCLKVVFMNYSMRRGCAINVTCDWYKKSYGDIVFECATCLENSCNKGRWESYPRNLKAFTLSLIVYYILTSLRAIL